MNIIFLGLGTNTGDRAMNLKKSIFALKNKGINIIAQSKIYETSPWGYTDQPDFLNACIKAETELSAEELLLTLKSLEKELGREESFRWGPRLIDIDILYFNSETISRNDLIIPHPGIANRDFVLCPLNDIAADFINPLNNLSTVDMLKSITDITAEVYDAEL